MRRSLAHKGARARKPYEQWDRLHRSPPGTLFHYTTAQGLLSMLGSNVPFVG